MRAALTGVVVICVFIDALASTDTGAFGAAGWGAKASDVLLQVRSFASRCHDSLIAECLYTVAGPWKGLPP